MWFSTHFVFLFRFKDGNHPPFRVLETVILLEAFDHEEASKKAHQMAKQEQDEFTGTFHLDGGRPADREFVGVRKAVVLDTEDGGTEVTFNAGQEMTCWEFEVREEEDIRRLMAGERVTITHIE